MPTTRCDLHVHSSASVVTDEWYTKRLKCAESYADPRRQYELCKSRGMDLVTLTDHDTIDGGLLLADRPDFFLSEEITTRFPENGCVMHVLAWAITPAEHEAIQSRRGDIYSLSDYLQDQRIPHAVAHPFLSPNWRLDPDTLEKTLLLFPAFESVNGLLDRRIDKDLRYLLDRLSPEVLKTLSRKHRIEPRGRVPHKKVRTAGSDDHVHRWSGGVFTEVAEESLNAKQFFDRVMAGEATLRGDHADLRAMALCIGHTAYSYLKRHRLEAAKESDPFLDFMDLLALGPQDAPPQAVPQSFAERAKAALLCGAFDNVQRFDIHEVPLHPSAAADAAAFDAIAEAHDLVVAAGIKRIVAGAQVLDVSKVCAGLGDVGGALMAALPFLFAADHFGKQRAQVDKVWAGWTAFAPPAQTQRLAVFSDTLGNVDGVSSWCERFAADALKAEKQVLLVTCSTHAIEGKANIPHVAAFALPFYQELTVGVPSLVRTVEWLWDNDVTHVELATAGPMGVVALAAAKLLKLPVTATHHTDLGDLVRLLSGNQTLAAAANSYTSWFYRSVDRVFAFSTSAAQRLRDLRVPKQDIEITSVAVDPDDFSPAHADRKVFAQMGIECGSRPIVLSVGRISVEKNIPLIIESLQNLQCLNEPPVLVVVGDGPEKTRLERLCALKPFVHFLGLQQGELLRRLYASADIFAFAGEVDTLGLVNLEALASGLAVLVPANSAAAQIVGHDVTGFHYELGVAGLEQGLREILQDPQRAARVSKQGRQLSLDRWKKMRFGAVWRAMTGVSRDKSAQ